MSAKSPLRAVVTRRFEAAASDVFDAWLKRDAIEQWMFGPAVADEEIVHLAIDPRVGGAFSYLIEREGEEVEILGRYLEVQRPGRLVFSWVVADEPSGSRVVVAISPDRSGCDLTLTQELHPARTDAIGPALHEWQRRLAALAAVVE